MVNTRGPWIVVGVTDTVGSRWALAWAVGAARRSRLPLKVVTAVPSAVRRDLALVTEHDHRVAADALVTALFGEVCDGLPADVHVERLVAIDTPGRALVAAAAAGDLLVIGSGGGWNGPTRRYCARRSRCPLVVVPRPDVGDLLGTSVTVTGGDSRPREVG